MKINPVLVMGTCISLLTPLAAQAAVQPDTGIYRAVLYIAKATPTAACATVGEPAGSSSTGVFYYPGPSAIKSRS